MERNNFYLVVSFTILLASCLALQESVNPDVLIAKVARSIDISTHLPRINSAVTLENTGKSVVRSFIYGVEPELEDKIAYIGAVIKSGEDETKLNIVEVSVKGQSLGKFFRVDLKTGLENGKTLTVDIETSFSHALQPYPSHITQAEKQLVKFTGNLYFFSPYTVKTQTTTVNTPTNSIQSHTKVQPVKVADNSITYGPYENIQPFTQAEVVVHNENNAPFLTISHLDRMVEVSHWGNIAVEETVDIRHTGAVLKGSFSRYDYQRNQDGVSSVKAFKTVLPVSAKDVYYRDEIGNISTSHLREMEDVVEVELRPRFPLFGGWKTHYVLGYNIPSYEYLFNKGDKYVLVMRFIDHVYDDQVIDHMSLRIVLPEGAKDIDFRPPYHVDRMPDQLHYTYLDTFGRPVIIVEKSSLVDNHIQDFELHYTFQKALLFQEPLLVVGAFYLLFIIVIIYVRLDFSITKDEASESRMRVAGLIEQVQAVQDRRSALYQSYDDAINKYKTSKDSNSFSANRKKIDTDHKQLTNQISGLQAKLKTEGSDVTEKVAELQKLDSAVRDQIVLAIQCTEKLMVGKMNKAQYVDNEANINGKREELLQKMENLLSSL